MMKFLLILFITSSAAFSTFAQEDKKEIDSMSLVLPLSYSRTPGKFQDSKSGSAIWFGDLFGAADIGDKIRKSLAPYKSDLASFYPAPGELDTLVTNLVNKANRDIVKGDLDDTKAIAVNRFFGNKLIGNIIDRILDKKGISDSSRRKIWVDKILAPFNSCIGRSTNALYAASHCMDALTNSLVPSAGVALIYEQTKSKLSGVLPESDRAKFNKDQVQIYIDCINSIAKTSANVELCAVKAMKAGVLKVTDFQLTHTLKSSVDSLQNVKNIKELVWPNFNTCIAKVSEKSKTPIDEQFTLCIDDVIKKTGAEVVKNKIYTTEAIKLQFTKKELDALAANKSNDFIKCIEDNIKKNIRKNGLVDSSSCENKITNDITYQVILKTFNSNASKMLSTTPHLIPIVSETAKTALDRCWKDDQSPKEKDQCISKSLIIFSKQIASLKLDAAVPDTIPTKADIIENALATLDDCLVKNLPKNVTESPNTEKKITECSDKLTRDVALTVAESEVRNTVKGKMTKDETDQFINKLIHKDFANCLGQKPTDTIINNCTDQLKIAASEKILDINLNAYLKDRPGQNLSTDRADIKSSLIKNLKNCLSNSKNKDGCTDELLKEANRKIVLAYAHAETKVQLSTDKTPEKLMPIEKEFINCTATELKGEKLSQHLDECNKKFAIEFARNLGTVKLNYLLDKALGTDTLKAQEGALKDIIGRYNKCLDELYKIKMDDGLTDKMTLCTKELESRALGLVRRNLADWMSSEQKDATTVAVKNEFAGIIPCLSVLLPSQPYDENLKNNADSILKPVALLVAQYIEYSPENARVSLNEIIAKLARDLSETGGTEKAKAELLDLLYQNGALDQFIRSMVRGKVKEAFKDLSEKDLPKNIKDMLVTKDNFDQIFNTPEGAAIKDYVHNAILKPLLIEGADFNSPRVKNSIEQVNNKVVRMLVDSPKFGDTIVKTGIQMQINEMGGFSRFMAKIFYGSDNLNWEKVRTSEAGKKAEQYIKENVLLPKFEGRTLTPKEIEKINEEAERLVKEAVKKY